MENTKETIDTLNDLVLINNDRIAGYEKALEELKRDDDAGQENLIAAIDTTGASRHTNIFSDCGNPSALDHDRAAFDRLADHWINFRIGDRNHTTLIATIGM